MGPLPPGRHGLSPEFVVESQRERAINALAHCTAQRGYEHTTIADIVKTASIARVTFYEHFGSKEQCFVAAFELFIDEAHRQIAKALRETPEFPERVVASLRALLELLSSQPELGRLCLLEAPGIGEPVGERYRHAIDRFVDLLRGCRPDTAHARDLSELAEPVLVNGIASLLARRIDAGGGTRLGDLLPELSKLSLSLYFGIQEAERMLERITAAERDGNQGQAVAEPRGRISLWARRGQRRI
jgi:AcrR family transcriptional regulator